MNASEPLFRIEGLRVAFDGRTALHGVDLTVRRGESVGLVGESGCGKSITWLASLGLLPASGRASGSVRIDGTNILNASAGRLRSVRGGRVAMIFQDPSSALNPVLRIGRQIGETIACHRGLTGTAQRHEARRLLERVGIPNAAARMGAYPHEMSGGQNQRVMIAMALAGEPDLLVADEPTTALDATVQAQILALIGDIQQQTGMGLVLISHDLGVVSHACDRVCVMYAGRIVEEAPVDILFDNPLHPYTRGLLDALPVLDGPRRPLTPVPGSVPEPWCLPPGCAFAPRCASATALCRTVEPSLTQFDGNGRAVACHHAVGPFGGIASQAGERGRSRNDFGLPGS